MPTRSDLTPLDRVGLRMVKTREACWPRPLRSDLGPPESAILAAIRQRLGMESDLVLWRLSQGGVVRRGRHTMRTGLVAGAADLIGILTHTDPSAEDGEVWGKVGRFVALEVKSARGRVSTEQAQWIELVHRHGGFAAVVRSVNDALHALDRARRGAES